MTQARRILIIDDSEVVLSELERVLTAAGYHVTATSQTVGAARHLMHADLVILDYHMPGIDGKQVLESMTAAVRHAANKPLFYLYTTDKELGLRAKSLGFDGVFGEKGDSASLVRQVGAAFRLSKLRRA